MLPFPIQYLVICGRNFRNKLYHYSGNRQFIVQLQVKLNLGNFLITWGTCGLSAMSDFLSISRMYDVILLHLFELALITVQISIIRPMSNCL